MSCVFTYTATVMGSITDQISIQPGADRDSRVVKFETEAAAQKAARLWADRMVATGAPCHGDYEGVRPEPRVRDIHTKTLALLATGSTEKGLTFLFKVEVLWTLLSGSQVTTEAETLVNVNIRQVSDLLVSEDDLDLYEVSSRALDVHLQRIENEKMIARMTAEREAIKQKFAKNGKRKS